MLQMLLQILFVLRVVVQDILRRTAKIRDRVVGCLMWETVVWMMRFLHLISYVFVFSFFVKTHFLLILFFAVTQFYNYFFSPLTIII